MRRCAKKPCGYHFNVPKNLLEFVWFFYRVDKHWKYMLRNLSFLHVGFVAA